MLSEIIHLQDQELSIQHRLLPTLRKAGVTMSYILSGRDQHYSLLLDIVFFLSSFSLMDFCFLLHSTPWQIVDSIMALFRVDFSGRGELADRQQKLAQLLSRLQKISEGLQHCSGVQFYFWFCLVHELLPHCMPCIPFAGHSLSRHIEASGDLQSTYVIHT